MCGLIHKAIYLTCTGLTTLQSHDINNYKRCVASYTFLCRAWE
jgi:hypothetical protein